MKKLKGLALLLLVISFSAFGQNKNFSIQGKAEIENGQMLVIAQNVEGFDTLAQSPIINGKFILKGKIGEAAESFLAAKGYEGGFQFFLEPGEKYIAGLKKTGKSFITGGKLQNEYVIYTNKVEEWNFKLRDKQKQIDSIRALGHFKTLRDLQEKLVKTRDSAKQNLAAILKRNENNLLGAYIHTANLKEVRDINLLTQVYAQLKPGARASIIGKKLAKRIRLLQKVDVSSIAPNFTLQTPEGEDISLYNLKGKLKMVDFWASWCGPCRLENPNVVDLYNKFKDKGLVVISVSLDEKKDAWLNAITVDGMLWHHASSLDGFDGKVVQDYQIHAVPAIFLLNEYNEIIAKDLRGENLKNFVEKYLNENK